MADTNICTIAGRLTREPELRTTTSGKSVATMTLATEDGWGDNKKTYFIPIVAWGKTAEACANYLVKGQKATVTGRITTRSWDGKDGKNILSPKSSRQMLISALVRKVLRRQRRMLDFQLQVQKSKMLPTKMFRFEGRRVPCLA